VENLLDNFVNTWVKADEKSMIAIFHIIHRYGYLSPDSSPLEDKYSFTKEVIQ